MVGRTSHKYKKILMNKPNKWIAFLKPILDKGGFLESDNSIEGETNIIIYRQLNQNSDLEIRIGYLNKDLLIYLTIYDPKIPGYNKYAESEYFYQHDFSDDGKTYGNPALEFNQRNQNGILSILTKGLVGKEVQYVKNNKVLKSKLYITESHPNFSYSYNFTKRGFWEKIFGEKIDNIDGVEKREIELSRIFGGIKDVTANLNNK